jgi:adenosylcobinamide-phosphate synthase
MLRVLLGGAWSGKSSLATHIARRSGRPVTFIATGERLDAEFAERIDRHRAERPGTWQTIEVRKEGPGLPSTISLREEPKSAASSGGEGSIDAPAPIRRRARPGASGSDRRPGQLGADRHGRARPTRGLLGVLAGVGAGAAVLVTAPRRLGGFTGDMLRAAGRVCETVGLVVAATRLSPTRGTDLASRLGGSAIGYLADQLVGEPPDRLHPLRAFGHLMASIERRTYRDDRLAGAGYAAVGLATGMLSGAALSSTTAGTYLSSGGRALAGAANVVDRALRESDLATAREKIRSLVGRDSDALEEGELVRAVVESVAENTVDGIVAPLFFAAAMGAPGALGYRAANTLDALVGYRSDRYEHFGWASARLDDALNYLPARVTALLVALVRPRRAVEVLRSVRRDAPAHPSPNAGVAEAAFAAALGLCLGGESSYEGKAETRPFLGNGRVPERSDIARAVRLSRHVGAAAAIGAVAASLGLCARRRANVGIGRR